VERRRQRQMCIRDRNTRELNLPAFFENQGPALLEIFTNSVENAAELKRYMSLFKA
jgi:2-succinyl-5-enolpyruvyl-6-hydroxy-3-cyclohexene-1-carboxylate synthase